MVHRINVESFQLPAPARVLLNLGPIECQITGVLRLAGRACLKRQVATAYPRYQAKSRHNPELGKHFSPQFLGCVGCPHFLSDSDYATARKAILKSKTVGSVLGSREVSP